MDLAAATRATPFQPGDRDARAAGWRQHPERTAAGLRAKIYPRDARILQIRRGGDPLTADPGAHPGYVLLRDGECCDDKIYPSLGITAELAAWWQRNNAAVGEVISVGAVTALAIPVETLRTMFPVRGKLSPGWLGRQDWADPGEPRGGPPWGPAPKPPGTRPTAGAPARSG